MKGRINSIYFVTIATVFVYQFIQEFSINIDDSCISKSFWCLVSFSLKGLFLIDFDESFRGLKLDLTKNLLQFHV